MLNYTRQASPGFPYHLNFPGPIADLQRHQTTPIGCSDDLVEGEADMGAKAEPSIVQDTARPIPSVMRASTCTSGGHDKNTTPSGYVGDLRRCGLCFRRVNPHAAAGAWSPASMWMEVARGQSERAVLAFHYPLFTDSARVGACVQERRPLATSCISPAAPEKIQLLHVRHLEHLHTVHGRLGIQVSLVETSPLLPVPPALLRTGSALISDRVCSFYEALREWIKNNKPEIPDDFTRKAKTLVDELSNSDDAPNRKRRRYDTGEDSTGSATPTLKRVRQDQGSNIMSVERILTQSFPDKDEGTPVTTEGSEHSELGASDDSDDRDDEEKPSEPEPAQPAYPIQPVRQDQPVPVSLSGIVYEVTAIEGIHLLSDSMFEGGGSLTIPTHEGASPFIMFKISGKTAMHLIRRKTRAKLSF
ncbi:hypothetical protein BDP81DRAFT_450449 [Colletotrichum phormii]|uniref:Uncharacterized protein n=1 Tax=Colletotrichum phormii TaxID=359342 RepID=A0AAI9ZP32_9PEZI|nr:uncharacterized protein BDP81DRAFT_450449 [Colletotrichum phormii]KAK1635577.1 hypothetical protein BDP81DRAFT_450449 [Colletotrichum phormii]